jgi:lipoprotein-anchoring transpeptidase ErfK/SrfK
MVARDDPFSQFYTIQPNDSLIRIARQLKVAADWRLLKRINRMSNPGALSIGQKLKVIQQPFHAVVYRSAYRMDVYLGPADQASQWVYIRSFRVGLGAEGKTPIGTFTVKKASKLVDPPWTHPVTGQRFAGGDPKNPIGLFWIGLQGEGEAAAFTGYGIHGTIEPESIGQERSMGCLRMLAPDVELVYELLGEQISTVQIRP